MRGNKMYYLTLKKGLSYSYGNAVKVDRKNPRVKLEDKKIADYLISTGYFKLEAKAEPAKKGRKEAEFEGA